MEIDDDPIEPRGWEQVKDRGLFLCACPVFPHIETPEAGMAIVLLGRQLNLPMTAAAQSIYVVNNRPALESKLMLALCVQSDLCEYFVLVEESPEYAKWETKRRTSPNPTAMTVTWEQAQEAGWPFGKDGRTLKAPWRDRAYMLSNRCISRLAKSVYPDLLRGMESVDDVRDSLSFRVEQPVEAETPVDSLKAKLEASIAAPVQPVVDVEAEPVQEAQPPVPDGQHSRSDSDGAGPSAPAGDPDELTADALQGVKEQLKAYQEEFKDLCLNQLELDMTQAKDTWSGIHGVKSLRGCRTLKSVHERLEQASNLVIRAKLAARRRKAWFALSDKVGADALSDWVRENYPSLVKSPWSVVRDEYSNGVDALESWLKQIESDEPKG